MTTKLVAKEPIRFGPGENEIAQPGDTFETTDGSAAQLIDLGHAELAKIDAKKKDK